MTAAAALLLLMLGIGLTILDYRRSTTAITGGIPRNAYGHGARVEELRVEADGKSIGNMQAEVSERAYTAKEVRELFKEAIQEMDPLILGENESPDRVESDLNLLTEIPGKPIDVSWEIDRYDVMNVYGELIEENLEEKGAMVTLRAVLAYRERKEEQALYERTVMVYPVALHGKERLVKKIREEILRSDERTRMHGELALPQKVEGKRLAFYPVMDRRGVVLLIMAMLILLLLYALDRQNKGKEEEKKRQQMRLDYPEIVSKLTLLLGAGMTVKRAWKKVAGDYAQREDKGVRYAYEEMEYTCREMESGVMESESYERFGRRCGLQEYVRLGALLSQNLRKGMKGLGDILRMETAQAFEERKARARRLGEEAGTKLLMPMFLMLSVVLVIVIVPAFLSIQL